MKRPCKIGIQLPEVEWAVTWPELIAMAQAAEAVGFDSLWLGDHLLYDLPDGSHRGPWEVWTSLAALAAVTTRIELGPLVACTSFHAPAMLAKQAATVDAISNGRLILGLGAGWNQREYTAYGFAYDQRVSASRRPSPLSGSCWSMAAATSTGASTTWPTVSSTLARHGRAGHR